MSDYKWLVGLPDETKFTPQQKALFQAMSDVSEEYYCAGWLTGNEYALWDMLNGGNKGYGWGSVSDEELAPIAVLSGEAQGWIIWVDDEHDPDLPASEWGPRFIGLPEWIEMYAARNYK